MIHLNEEQALELSKKIILNVLHKTLDFSLNQIFEKYAFDAKLPYQVKDSTTGEITWADSINSEQFITLANSEKWEKEKSWKLDKIPIHSFMDLMPLWKKINYVTTERVYDSENVSKSDTIYRSFNVYHSTNCSDSKNVVFCNGLANCEDILASSRSFRCTNCIRVDDSANCSNSYNVICSGKVSNCLFIQDCSNLDECIFCSHISNCRFCICNMQFEKEEYQVIKEAIIDWILYS